MLKIEFDPSNTKLALAIGNALVSYAGGVVAATVAQVLPGEVHDVSIKVVTDATAAPSAAELAAYDREVLGQNNEGDTIGGDNPAYMEQHIPEVGKSASVAGQDTTAAQTATQSADVGGVTTGKPTHDEKGVMFIPAICANAAKPFYASGPYKGQWKKGTKVDQAEYDRVYSEALAALGSVQTGRIDCSQVNTVQTQVGQSVANSSAAQVFGGGQQQADPLTQTLQEHPATPAEAFEVYTYLLQNGGEGVANAICLGAGLANGTLIFSRPDLAARLYKELTTQKAQLVGTGA